MNDFPWRALSGLNDADRSGLSGTPVTAAIRRTVFAVTILGTGVFPLVAGAQDRDPMLIYDADGTTVRGHLQFGLNAVSEQNLFWDLAEATSPGSGFDPDTNWLEGYVKPGLSFEHQLDGGAVLYGKLSGVASYT